MNLIDYSMTPVKYLHLIKGLSQVSVEVKEWVVLY